MIRFVLSVAVLTSVLCPPQGAEAQQRRRFGDTGYESRVDTTFAFDKNGSVNLSVVNGEIIVTGWTRSEMRIRAVSDDDNIRLTGSSSRVTLDVAGSRRGGDARFEVTVPFGVRVNAQSASGDISVRGTRGPVEVHAQNGDIDVDEVQTRLDITSLSGDVIARSIGGDVTVNSVSGEVHLTDVRGGVDVATVSGDIDLRGVAAKSVRAKTTSGEVRFEGSIDQTGRYEFNSHSGDIGLRIPRDASAQFTVSTWSGTIDSQFQILLRPGDEQSIGVTKSKRYTFEIGGGGARITVEAFSGDITISSSGRGGVER
ncbi:MAG TPA: DUF4097 family beta strand repeat-containing protein [Gemmatimonadaceae bacterium]